MAQTIYFLHVAQIKNSTKYSTSLLILPQSSTPSLFLFFQQRCHAVSENSRLLSHLSFPLYFSLLSFTPLPSLCNSASLSCCSVQERVASPSSYHSSRRNHLAGLSWTSTTFVVQPGLAELLSRCCSGVNSPPSLLCAPGTVAVAVQFRCHQQCRRRHHTQLARSHSVTIFRCCPCCCCCAAAERAVASAAASSSLDSPTAAAVLFVGSHLVVAVCYRRFSLNTLPPLLLHKR